MEIWNNEIHQLYISKHGSRFKLIHGRDNPLVVLEKSPIALIKKYYRHFIKVHNDLGLTDYYKKYRWA